MLDFIGHAPPAMKASMALDLQNRGNRLELALAQRQGGEVALGRKPRRADADACMLYAVLKPYAMGAPS